MLILSPSQIKQADEFTIKSLPISSIDLMERAAQKCAEAILQKYSITYPVYIFCGKGNNGGDGLAIARLLKNEGYIVNVFVIEYSTNASIDFQENLKKCNAEIKTISDAENLPKNIHADALIIDAILGNGLNKSLHGLIKSLVEKLNEIDCNKLAIDIPTGLYSDIQNIEEDAIFKADKTLTFQAPKLNFMFKENYQYVGDVSILDIGWPDEIQKEFESNYNFTDDNSIKKIYRKRNKHTSKHDLGHALIIAGSYGKMGAALLSTKACLRAGAGLTTVYIPASGYEVLQSQAPEAMCIIDSCNEYLSSNPNLENYNVVAIGPGIGFHPQTKSIVRHVINNAKQNIVIDADALNIIAEDVSILSSLKAKAILTPHTKEFDRLTNKHKSDFERLNTAIAFAKQHKIVLVLKGAFTAVISSDGEVHFNSTGNSSLAKGGSGDTLTGIITALVAQGYTNLHAAILGVYLHGLCADICIETNAPESIIAADIINALGKAFKKIF